MANTTTTGRGRGQTQLRARVHGVLAASPVAGSVIRIKPAALADKQAIDLLLRAGCLLQVVGR